MVDNVYCTVSAPEQAREAIARMALLGFRAEEVIVANQPSEVEALMHTGSDSTRSTLLGVLYGFIFGFILGVLNLAITGHGVWTMWGVPLIPVMGGLCWGLVGSIIGCSGLLVARKVPEDIEHKFEEEVADAKLLVAVPLRNRGDFAAVRETLLKVGAAGIYYTGDVA